MTYQKNRGFSAALSSGFSLIEVMVAMLIVSIGVLGMTGLQVMSMHNNQSALLASDALMIGNSIIDRMRANEITDYAPVTLNSAPPTTATDCVALTCEPDAMALYDIAQWKCSINDIENLTTGARYAACVDLASVGSLPDGKGSITKTANTYTVTVEWRDERSGNRRTIAMRTQIGAI